MTDDLYLAKKAKLRGEMMSLKKRGMKRSAMARARMIADLEYDYNNTPREKTMKELGY